MNEPNDTDLLIAQAELGKDAREFLEGDLGKCLLGFARQEVELAKEKLCTVKAGDIEAVQALQNEAALGVRFERWLVELVQEGDDAIKVLKQQQE